MSKLTFAQSRAALKVPCPACRALPGARCSVSPKIHAARVADAQRQKALTPEQRRAEQEERRKAYLAQDSYSYGEPQSRTRTPKAAAKGKVALDRYAGLVKYMCTVGPPLISRCLRGDLLGEPDGLRVRGRAGPGPGATARRSLSAISASSYSPGIRLVDSSRMRRGVFQSVRTALVIRSAITCQFPESSALMTEVACAEALQFPPARSQGRNA
jgi:hypothetical protein